MMDRLKDALNEAGFPFVLYAWDTENRTPKKDHGVISLDEGADLDADDTHAERGTLGFCDYFTKSTSKNIRNGIEDVLNAECDAWSLSSVQFENDTGFIHYEWRIGWYG